MRVTFTPQSLYDTPAALKDGRYRAWLSDFCNAGQRLSGVNPCQQVRLASRARRWFLDGLSPYEAVQKWQGHGRRAMRNPRFGGLFGRRRPRYRSIAEGREAYNRLGPSAYWAQFGRQPQAWELEDMPRRRRRRRRNPDHGDILDLALPALVLFLLIRGGTLRPAA